MPRGKRDLFSQVRRQAKKALAILRREIQRRQNELNGLLAQADRWRDAIDGTRFLRRGPGRPPGRRAAAGATRRATSRGRARGSGRRVNWDAVLASVPEKFGVADVMKHPGARAKGRPQVYPALTRWLEAKKVKKIGKGRYQRL
jgi:hypothetical protein